MNRRRFIRNLAVTAAAAEGLEAIEPPPQEPASTEGYTLIAELDGWKVHEDLRTRDGSIVFTGPRGVQRVMTKSAEACFATAASVPGAQCGRHRHGQSRSAGRQAARPRRS